MTLLIMTLLKMTTYNDFTYNDFTSSAAIQLARFLITFLLLQLKSFISKISYKLTP